MLVISVVISLLIVYFTIPEFTKYDIKVEKISKLENKTGEHYFDLVSCQV